jgi:4-aminobutyrate aminotransferase-like enzyme
MSSDLLDQNDPLLFGSNKDVGLVGIELVEDLETKAPAAATAGKIRAAMREKGVLIGVGGGFANVLRVQPPLSISKEELTQVVDTLKEILES